MKVTNGEKWRRKLPILKDCPVGTVFRVHEPRSEALMLTNAVPSVDSLKPRDMMLEAFELSTGRAFCISCHTSVILYPDAEVILHSDED